MNPQQVALMKQQLDQELEYLLTSMQQIQVVKNKYQESCECVKKHSTIKEESSILVPLTGSMYVNGNVLNSKKFTVDIGTGYYVEKDLNSCLEFFKRKSDFLDTQLEKLVKIIQEKSALRQMIKTE